jgi:predicted ATPase/DNA-binding winged helix-turn-helix (wHTH) protein/Flp pilus assembly protein TadD
LQTNVYNFGKFELDLARGCLLKADVEIKLRPKVYEALKYLVENPGRLISKKELIQAVWPDSFVTDDSLVQCTVELRRALQDGKQQLLKTAPRRGYVFTADVVRQAATPDHPPAASSEPLQETHQPPIAKPAKKRYGLPTPRTSLIGREQHIEQAAELLLRPNVRLLTFIGPGGAGKTRLALATAARLSDYFTGGLQFVGLSSILDPDLVDSEILKALEIQRVASRTFPEMIGEQFQNSGPFLLLLDNFEQVLPAATVVSQVLEACPCVTILVTSRASLRIYGEQEFPVTPLEHASAVELFVRRAQSVRPSFAVNGENEVAIREICSKLDGLPLAIELAAARTKVLSPDTMLDRLQSRLQLLTGGSLDLPQRQQTLRNAIDWSHELLNEPEQKLLRRLSVFVGGCALEAAEAVCDTGRDLDIDVFEGLSSLVDKNLIQNADSRGTEPRFAMLETIREYALERLASTKEELATRRAHAAYCLVLAEEGNPELEPAERTAWLSRCDIENDNFRSALDWLFQNRELDWGLRICMALFKFWDMREHLTEGRARLDRILSLTEGHYPNERARVASFVGALTTTQGDFTAAQRYLQLSLSLYQQLGDEWGIGASLNALAISSAISQRDSGDHSSAEANFEKSLAYWRTLGDQQSTARCLHNLANIIAVRGDYSRAQAALREATSIFEEIGDRSGAAWSINQQGDIAREQGAMDAARGLYQRALAAFREAGDRWGSGRSLADLGYICCEQGDYEVAKEAYREALKIFTELGHRRGLARGLEGCACLALAQGSPASALTFAAAAAHIRHEISAPLPYAEQSKLDQRLQRAWGSLSHTEGAHAWSEGSAMSAEKAVKCFLGEKQRVTSAS